MTRNILDLAKSFHVLVEADGLHPWHPGKLDAWACEPIRGDASKHAARFVLAVWNPLGDWKCGRFDMAMALCKWDQDNRGAFIKWASNPWFV